MQEKAKSYRDLVIWQKSHNLVIEIYKITKLFPKEELFGLTSQLRRVSVSVPANIAEGFARPGLKDKLKFYSIASGSLNETGYFLFLSNELGYADTSALVVQVEEIGKMLNRYIKTIQTNSNF
ncbi:MAG: four helix bundle protein [Bacteroidales bacterium]